MKRDGKMKINYPQMFLLNNKILIRQSFIYYDFTHFLLTLISRCHNDKKSPDSPFGGYQLQYYTIIQDIYMMKLRRTQSKTLLTRWLYYDTTTGESFMRGINIVLVCPFLSAD
jgi:hypothetical protein